MQIQHEELDGRGSFFITQGDDRVAEMTYRMSHAGKMIIDHTEVDESLQGKHIGNQLLDTAVGYARTNNLKIVPVCSFAKFVFEKNKDIQDVLS